jgi:hypothetical protein
MSKKKKILLIVLTTISLPIGIIIIWHSLNHYYLPPFEGKVIDSETKEPIEGAAVLAVYYRTVHTIAGSNSYAFDGQEARTDANGEFNIVEQSGWFGEISGWARAQLVIFKPGYGVFPTHQKSKAIGTNKTWPEPKKYFVYEIAKLRTVRERETNLHFLGLYDIPSSKRRYLTTLINKELTILGFEPYTLQ